MKKVLVLCTGNSCRSQIAEGYLRYFAGNKAMIYSAGLEAHGVNSSAIATMAEEGLDISKHTSNHLNDYQGVDFDFIITVCDNAREHCPYYPAGALQFHHNFPDPARAHGTDQQIAEKFREVRNLIRVYTENFAREHF